MLKKILILLSICFIAFTACKKQQTTEPAENKTDVSTTAPATTAAEPAQAEVVTTPVVNELITINVLEKQNDAQYTTGEKAKFLAGSHMTDKNIAISLLGVLFLYLYYFIKINFVLSEMILIVGWVAIWEAVYAWLFVRDKDNIKIKRLKKLANCEIKFE